MVTSGLRFCDLEAWQRWSARQGAVRALASRVRHASRPVPPPPAILSLPAEEPTALVVVDMLTSSCRAAVAAPVSRMNPRTTAVLSRIPEAVDMVKGGEQLAWRGTDGLPNSIDQVLTLGSYCELAGQVKPWCHSRDIRFVVAQHGLITPWAPPLADGDHFLAWSQSDAEYQTEGWSSVTVDVVGSQMMWEAAALPEAQVLDDRPVMLGQLHGIELGRVAEQRIYTGFCTQHGADYRPHPNEADILSRAQHGVMRRAGVHFETSGLPLAELGRPVVSIFSTGTLEAAQRGLPAWVYHPRPPDWIRDFWTRYGLSQLGSAPTAPPVLPDVEPATQVARIMEE